jgi:hypothetical protein
MFKKTVGAKENESRPCTLPSAVRVPYLYFCTTCMRMLMGVGVGFGLWLAHTRDHMLRAG